MCNMVSQGCGFRNLTQKQFNLKNSIDPDEAANNDPHHMGLDCLPSVL